MSGFLLTDQFSESIDGHAINPHFANVLRVLDMCESAENGAEQFNAIDQHFFVDSSWTTQKDDVNMALGLFIKFMSAYNKTEEGAPDSGATPPRQNMCFRFDAPEIYADFMREYDICLSKVEYLHWHEFLLLLNDLSSDSRLKQKVDLRFKNLADIKDPRQRSVIQKAKDAVQIPVKLSEAELEHIDDILAIMASSRDRLK